MKKAKVSAKDAKKEKTKKGIANNHPEGSEVSVSNKDRGDKLYFALTARGNKEIVGKQNFTMWLNSSLHTDDETRQDVPLSTGAATALGEGNTTAFPSPPTLKAVSESFAGALWSRTGEELAQQLFEAFGRCMWPPEPDSQWLWRRNQAQASLLPPASSLSDVGMLTEAIRQQRFRDPKDLPAPELLGLDRPLVKENWQAPDGQAPQKPYPVIHFLFLVEDELVHAHYWRSFFSGAPRVDAYRAWIHFSKQDASVSDTLRNAIPGIRAVPTVFSKWCTDLVTAMVQLLQAAIQDDTVPPESFQKFVFISDTTLPVKPFRVMYRTLSADTASDFYFRPMKFWRVVFLPKHSQWVVLNRFHARKMVEAWQEPHESSLAWDVPVKDELGPYSSSVRGVNVRHFFNCESGQACPLCIDEYAFFSKIFGAPVKTHVTTTQVYPDLGTIRLDEAANHSPQGRPRTLVLFGWKEWPDGELEMMKDPELKGFCPAAHPWTFDSLGPTSLRTLRASPYLFARKFVHNVSMPGYESIILEIEPATFATAI